MTDEETEEDEWEYYFIHDSIGVSHIMRKLKGELPLVRCTNCED